MGGASSIAENTEMARRDHISAEGQGLISGVNMESSEHEFSRFSVFCGRSPMVSQNLML